MSKYFISFSCLISDHNLNTQHNSYLHKLISFADIASDCWFTRWWQSRLLSFIIYTFLMIFHHFINQMFFFTCANSKCSTCKWHFKHTTQTHSSGQTLMCFNCWIPNTYGCFSSGWLDLWLGWWWLEEPSRKLHEKKHWMWLIVKVFSPWLISYAPNEQRLLCWHKFLISCVISMIICCR